MPEAAPVCRDAVLRAARELMVVSGYAAMSMRQLAARVGLQPGSLYHHVASKQDLLLDVLVDIHQQRLRAWRSDPQHQGVRRYLRFLLERQRRYPDEALLLRHETRHLNDDQRPWLAQAQAQLQAPLRAAIERGQREGRYPPQDSTQAAEMILALVDAADSIRQRLVPVSDAWLEDWVLHMSLALLQGPVTDRPPILSANSPSLARPLAPGSL